MKVTNGYQPGDGDGAADASRLIVTHMYDLGGRFTGRIGSTGEVVTSKHDALWRPLSQATENHIPWTPITTYAFDRSGHPVKIINPDGGVTSYNAEANRPICTETWNRHQPSDEEQNP